MRVGVNYVPRENWFYSWLDFNLDAVKRDMADIAGLGLDHVRIFPLWPLLQPNPTLILDAQIEHVRQMALAATQQGLEVTVDILQGHLSSFDFLPSWVLSWHRSNMFTDPQVVDAEARLIDTLAAALSGLRGVRGLSLGNEVVQFAASRHPHPQQVTSGQAEAWVRRLLGEAERVWPAGEHTFSYDDDLFFDSQHPFGPELLATCGDVTTVHSWVFGKLGAALGPDHPRLGLFARYLLEVAGAWAPGKPLWLQEVGAPLNFVSQVNVPEFVHETLSQVAAVPGTQAITWWCSHDVSRDLAGFPAVEYDLGLWDSEGKLKPAGHALRDWIRNPEAAQAPGAEGLAIPQASAPNARAAISPDGPLFDAWATAIEAGHPVTLEVQP